MFTGIVEDIGVVREASPASGGRHLVIQTHLAPDIGVGESIAVNGTCLTAERVGVDSFTATAVPQTLLLTTVADFAPGTRVNLERAVGTGRLFGGHIVQGHVDGIAHVRAVSGTDSSGASRWLDLDVPATVADLCVERGSITVDGVSLTLAGVEGVRVRIALVPHTLQATIAGGYAAGVRVNVEADVVARYVREFVRRQQAAAR